MRITTDTELIIRIDATLLTGVGDVVAISEFGGGGLLWRRQGSTMYAYLGAQWLAESLAALGGVIIAGLDLSEVG